MKADFSRQKESVNLNIRKIILSENRKKRIKKNELNLRDLWDVIKWTNTHIVEVSEEENRKR